MHLAIEIFMFIFIMYNMNVESINFSYDFMHQLKR